MKNKLQLTRHSIPFTTTKNTGRRFLRDACAMRAWKRGIATMIVERIFTPVLRGEVKIKDVIIPPGGWERIERTHQRFASLPPADQLRIALHG